MVRVQEVMEKGTVALEIKSGYGLNPEDELKMLRVIRRIRETVPAAVKSTFLGAHAVGLSHELGSVTVGKKAGLILTHPGWNLTKIAYHYQPPFLREVFF